MTGDPHDPKDREISQMLIQLKEERAKLRSLKELHALKLKNNSNRAELDAIISQVQQVQGETIRLTLKIEEFTGQVLNLESEINGRVKDSNDGKDSSRGFSV